jgi:hypothetical protein
MYCSLAFVVVGGRIIFMRFMAASDVGFDAHALHP